MTASFGSLRHGNCGIEHSAVQHRIHMRNVLLAGVLRIIPLVFTHIHHNRPVQSKHHPRCILQGYLCEKRNNPLHHQREPILQPGHNSNVGGSGVGAAAVRIRGDRIGRYPMTRNWGQNWQCNWKLMVTTSDGRVTTSRVADSSWQFGQTFQGAQVA
ncbi:unnamed protein product [Sphagnum tenellum]